MPDWRTRMTPDLASGTGSGISRTSMDRIPVWIAASIASLVSLSLVRCRDLDVIEGGHHGIGPGNHADRDQTAWVARVGGLQDRLPVERNPNGRADRLKHQAGGTTLCRHDRQLDVREDRLALALVEAVQLRSAGERIDRQDVAGSAAGLRLIAETHRQRRRPDDLLKLDISDHDEIGDLALGRRAECPRDRHPANRCTTARRSENL